MVWNRADTRCASLSSPSAIYTTLKTCLGPSNLILTTHSIKPAWLSQVHDLVEIYKAPDQPSSYTERWKNFFTTPVYSQLFEQPTIKEEWPTILRMTKEVAIQMAMSASMLAIQNDETKRQVRAELDRILERGEEKKWIDEQNGVFESPYRTLVAVARKREPELS